VADGGTPDEPVELQGRCVETSRRDVQSSLRGQLDPLGVEARQERLEGLLDGVFASDAAGVVVFHPARRITTLDVAEVLAAVEPGISRLVDRRGLGQGEAEGGGADAWADEAPVLAGLAAGSCAP
jgi:hypothetical protein